MSLYQAREVNRFFFYIN